MAEYAGIHVLDNPYFLDTPFDYFLPPSLCGKVSVGDMVVVPFGNANRRCLGLVVSVKNDPDDPKLSCKPVLSVCDRSLSLSEEMFGLCFFMKEKTLCTVGDAVRAICPTSVISQLTELFSIKEAPYVSDTADAENEAHMDEASRLILEHIRRSGKVTLEALKREHGRSAEHSIKTLLRLDLIERDFELRTTSEKTETHYALACSTERIGKILSGEDSIRIRSEAQVSVLRKLCDIGSESISERELRELCKVSTVPLNGLCAKGLIQKIKKTVDRGLLVPDGECEQRPIVLNDEQSAAMTTLCSLCDCGEARAALLYGVTGSGKTSVMLRTIDHVLESGRGVIVLLPEIALTPQSLAIFCSRYGKRVAVIHSGLSAGERFDTYKRIKQGEADVVIGTRSAVFAPIENLGMIIIDEEQEHTYKSDMSPKYHARDIARYRCAWHKGLMLLASATPSFESYLKASKGTYTLIELKKRYGNAVLPTTTIVDMRREGNEGNTSPLSNLLCKRLVENHKAGNQSILFLNRRGYNNFISCRTCGKPLQCPRCSVSMTYHTFGNSYERGELRCHWCGIRSPLPEVCPECGGTHLSRMGYGTQRIEQEISELLPSARILRMDADTTASRYSYESILGKFRRHEADILLGTQMVTKGHDFPDVTLVGVLLADTSLYLDDYRAAERTFAMLTQVIGRAGRGEKRGEAIIQTANPQHECIRLACAQDFSAFFANEIRLRRALQFPPYCDIALFTLTSTFERDVLRAAEILRAELLHRHKESYADLPIDCFGPFEAPVYRVENRYRMRMVVKCRLNQRSRALFSEILAAFSNANSRSRTTSVSVDFNPSNL